MATSGLPLLLCGRLLGSALSLLDGHQGHRGECHHTGRQSGARVVMAALVLMARVTMAGSATEAGPGRRPVHTVAQNRVHTPFLGHTHQMERGRAV